MQNFIIHDMKIAELPSGGYDISIRTVKYPSAKVRQTFGACSFCEENLQNVNRQRTTWDTGTWKVAFWMLCEVWIDVFHIRLTINSCH
jgi:hypothetical protein